MTAFKTHPWLRNGLALLGGLSRRMGVAHGLATVSLLALVLLLGVSVIAQDGSGSDGEDRPGDPSVLIPDLTPPPGPQIDPDRRSPGDELDALLKNSSVALYDHFGWSDASAPITNSINANAQKILQVVEQGTSNVFEVDFNRVQPGTIITNIPITITQPGYYYLIGDLTNSVASADGITIDVDDVTLDLMGHTIWGTLRSGVDGDDGILVDGSQTNIKIRNGAVVGWLGDGIDARSADFSIWVDLHVRSNNGDGLVTDFNNLIDRVSAYSNGVDGIEGDDGTVVYNSTAGYNGDSGIQTDENTVVVNSTSFFNASDGFSVDEGSTIRNCSASGNGDFGFDIAEGTQATECTAYQNVSNGFDVANACILRDCVSSFNGGHGVRTFSNSWVLDNHFHANGIDGIRISSTDVQVRGNIATGNGIVGIHATSSGSFLVNNRASGNVTNFRFAVGSAFGPIVDVTNAGDITSVPNADHPWANFEY